MVAAAGFHFDTLPSIKHFSEVYSTFSPSIVELKEVAQKTLSRVAFVGTPCQINALRRMEVLGVVPSEAISIHLTETIARAIKLCMIVPSTFLRRTIPP